MPIFKGKPEEPVRRSRLQFQEQTYWAGVMGMCLGYLVGLAWMLVNGFVIEFHWLQKIIGTGVLTIVGKMLLDMLFVSQFVPFAVRKAAKRCIFLDEADLARHLPLPQIVFTVSGAAMVVAILLAELGWSEYEILWACGATGLLMGALRHRSDREQLVRARG